MSLSAIEEQLLDYFNRVGMKNMSRIQRDNSNYTPYQVFRAVRSLEERGDISLSRGVVTLNTRPRRVPLAPAPPEIQQEGAVDGVWLYLAPSDPGDYVDRFDIYIDNTLVKSVAYDSFSGLPIRVFVEVDRAQFHRVCAECIGNDTKSGSRARELNIWGIL